MSFSLIKAFFYIIYKFVKRQFKFCLTQRIYCSVWLNFILIFVIYVLSSIYNFANERYGHSDDFELKIFDKIWCELRVIIYRIEYCAWSGKLTLLSCWENLSSTQFIWEVWLALNVIYLIYIMYICRVYRENGRECSLVLYIYWVDELNVVSFWTVHFLSAIIPGV